MENQTNIPVETQITRTLPIFLEPAIMDHNPNNI